MDVSSIDMYPSLYLSVNLDQLSPIIELDKQVTQFHWVFTGQWITVDAPIFNVLFGFSS